jgi:hypothetical protein
MDVKRLLAVTTCALIAVAAGWTFLVVNYESDLGTNNIIRATDAGENATSGTNDPLVVLDFSEGDDDLSWSSMQLAVVSDGTTFTCSFGSQTTEDAQVSKVSASLGADGRTFTTVVDATDEDTFTHLDLPGQSMSDEANHTLRFSKTDAFLADGVQWAFVEDVSFQSMTEYDPGNLSNLTEDRLEWYTYDFAEHRVQPNDGFYVIQTQGMMFKVQFLSYYDQADEGRHPTLLTAALNGTSFPALSDTDLVQPSPCLIQMNDAGSGTWLSNASITLVENGVQICDGPCDLTVEASYETFRIQVEGIEAIV